MTAPVRVTYRTRAVLRVGTVYPILDRLQQSGWAVTRPETGPHPGRPARLYWRLTGHGKQQAQKALAPICR